LLRHDAHQQSAAIAANQLHAVGVLCDRKRSLRVQHDVDEARQSRRHLVEPTAAGGTGEQRLVPCSEISRHVLQVVE